MPTAAFAQSKPVSPKIGIVSSAPRQFTEVLVDLIAGGVRDSSRSTPQAEAIVRLSNGDSARLAALTDEVLALNVSVLLGDGPKHLRIAQSATRTVPIVAIDFEDDPVAAGYARSIARPGGNVTGVFLDLPDFASKWIEFLRECMPRLSSVALMWDPSTGPTQLSALTKIAGTLGIRTEIFEMKERNDYASAFVLAKDHGTEAAILLSTPLIPSITRTSRGAVAAPQDADDHDVFGLRARGWAAVLRPQSLRRVQAGWHADGQGAVGSVAR